MRIKEQTRILKDVILNNPDGFTTDFKGRSVNKNKGFFIGITDIKGKNLNYLIEKVLFIKRAGFKENKNLLIGGWRDSDGAFYLDLSLYVEDKKTAEKVGILFNQKAVFNIGTFKEIYLK